MFCRPKYTSIGSNLSYTSVMIYSDAKDDCSFKLNLGSKQKLLFFGPAPLFCYLRNKPEPETLVKCPNGTTHCASVGDIVIDKVIQKGCAVPGQNEGCSMKNGTKTCICHGDKCNQDFEIKCYIANQTTSATLQVCPFEAIGCYVARDEQTWKLIEAGCDVGDEGGHHVEKCFGDGCNHPFHCYDVGRNNMQQCDHHVTTCYTTFGKFS
uniref:EB domain-containing protein n=1 Tax=Panagrolaimus sp. JU765 TaxID=591449 RepID=A0AC34RI05_9BILA